MKRIMFSIGLFAAMAATAFAADLYVEAQFDITGKVPAKNYLTVKGPGESVEKDSVDAVSGASKGKGTDILNTYRNGADKKSTLPGGLQSLFKYGVSPEKYFVGDAFSAQKATDGTITVQYCHRGTAYLMVSDKQGRFTLPGAYTKARKIANLEPDGSQTVSKDFSATGQVAAIDWAKVWNTGIRDGTVIVKGKTSDGKVVEVKTGKVVDDVAASSTPYTGTIQLTLVGNVMTMKADLYLKK